MDVAPLRKVLLVGLRTRSAGGYGINSEEKPKRYANATVLRVSHAGRRRAPPLFLGFYFWRF